MHGEKQINRIVQEAGDLLNKRQVFVLATIIAIADPRHEPPAAK
jgi:hypothetical protein